MMFEKQEWLVKEPETKAQYVSHLLTEIKKLREQHNLKYKQLEQQLYNIFEYEDDYLSL